MMDVDFEAGLPNLPEKWIWASIGELYNIVGGGTPSTDNTEYWNGDIPWITSADIHGLNDIKPRRFINIRAIEESATNLVPEGSLIVVTRVGLGKVALSKTHLCFSQDLQALIGNNSIINTRYALHYLSGAVQIFKYNSRGTTIAGVTKKQLSLLHIPLPPLSEQHRIVARIEELFSHLDAGIEALQKAKAQLQRYRQAVLKAAVEGRLTEEWRNVYPDVETIRAPTQTESVLSSELPMLPNSWDWFSFSQLIKGSQNGLSKRRSEEGDPVHVLRLADIINNMISSKNPRDIKLTKQELNKYLIQEGDLLCIRVNGSKNLVGKMIPFINNDKWAFCDHFIRFKLDKELVLSSYLSIYFNTKIARKYIELNMVSSAGQNTISQRTLALMPVPLPSIEEQDAIITEIDRMFSILDALESSLDKCLERSNRLRQSILKHAFEGKLVLQDPNDEPVSVFMKLIKAEMANNSTRTGRRTKCNNIDQRRLIK